MRSSGSSSPLAHIQQLQPGDDRVPHGIVPLPEGNEGDASCRGCPWHTFEDEAGDFNCRIVHCIVGACGRLARVLGRQRCEANDVCAKVAPELAAGQAAILVGIEEGKRGTQLDALGATDEDGEARGNVLQGAPAASSGVGGCSVHGWRGAAAYLSLHLPFACPIVQVEEAREHAREPPTLGSRDVVPHSGG